MIVIVIVIVIVIAIVRVRVRGLGPVHAARPLLPGLALPKETTNPMTTRGGMLHTLGKRRDDGAGESVVDHLLACHHRIRHFTGVATALAEAPSAPPDEVASAAAGVLRYFSEALPKHSADEDASIAPRLAPRADDTVRAALTAMEEQHEALHRTLDRACDLWAAVAEDPTKLAALAPDLARVAADLAAQWDVHLALEEATIFPAARALLTRDEEAEIQGEMIARRRGDP